MSQAPPPSDERVRSLRQALRETVAVVLLLSVCQLASAASVSEAKLKSAFIYNFTKFVEWPPARFASAADPIVIGLLADAAMRDEIVAITASRLVNGRTLIVRTVASAAEMQACHVLYVSRQEQKRFVTFRDHAPLPAMLIVGDDQECRMNGGSICFSQRHGKLRFEINMHSVDRSQLRISAQLQKLAVAVNKGP